MDYETEEAEERCEWGKCHMYAQRQLTRVVALAIRITYDFCNYHADEYLQAHPDATDVTERSAPWRN